MDAEFERLLDEHLRAWLFVGNSSDADRHSEETRAALIAHHERVVQERDNWQETAARHWSNELFYSGLLRDVGSLFPDCYVSDDGSVQDQPLALKVKECVQAALAERDARIAELEDQVNTVTSAYNDMAAVLCDPDGNVSIRGSDGDRKVLQNAIDAARKGGER